MASDAARRSALGAFLRSRRARLAPEAVGLPAGERRRVPGLRREEVAQLADVGVTWYTWLEQGRPIQPSPGVLDAIARALRLDGAERRHLLALARPADAPEGSGGTGGTGTVGAARPAGAGPDDDAPGRPDLAGLVAAFGAVPAYALTARFDVLAANDAARALLGDLTPRDGRPANLLRIAFTDPAWRRLVLDWEREATRHVAIYRAAMAVHVDDPAWTALPRELSERSESFRRLWADADVAGPELRRKRFHHPLAGPLTLDATSLWAADDPGVRIVVLQPSGAADRERLARLHAVGGAG